MFSQKSQILRSRSAHGQLLSNFAWLFLHLVSSIALANLFNCTWLLIHNFIIIFSFIFYIYYFPALCIYFLHICRFNYLQTIVLKCEFCAKIKKKKKWSIQSSTIFDHFWVCFSNYSILNALINYSNYLI